MHRTDPSLTPKNPVDYLVSKTGIAHLESENREFLPVQIFLRLCRRITMVLDTEKGINLTTNDYYPPSL